MGSMNQPDNVIPIVSAKEIGKEIGKEVTQEQIMFISTGKASPDFVAKFIQNRISKEDIQGEIEKDKDFEDNYKKYLMSLPMELLISLVKFVEEKRNEPSESNQPNKSEVSMDSITKFIEKQQSFGEIIEKEAA